MSNELNVSYTGSSDIYCTVRRESDSKIWDVINSEYATEVGANWTDYALSLTQNGEDYYSASMPSSVAGWYSIIYREEAATNPDVDDLILRSDRVYWTGTTISGGVTPAGLSQWALVGLEQTKRFLNIDNSDTSKDSLLVDLINFVTYKMEKLADRKFKARTFREKVHARKYDNIILRNWPIHYVKRVCQGTEACMRLVHSGSELRVTAGVGTADRPFTTTDQNYFVVQVINSSGDETVYTLDLYTYKTIQALATYINSNIANVTATVIKNAPSLDLWERANIEFTNSQTDIQMLNSSNADVEWELQSDVGALKLNNNACEWVIVEYYGGLIEDDIEHEWYHAVSVCLECVREMYNQIGKDTSLTSHQFDQGENLNIATLVDSREIDNRILSKIADFKDFALPD